jgi:putative heme-binding domain-containing protein
MHKDIAPLESLLKAIIDSKDSALRANVVLGVSDAMKGWAKAPEPKPWLAFSASVKDHEGSLSQTVRELGVVFGDGRAMTQVREMVLDEKAEIGLRRSAFISLLKQRPADLNEICVKMIGDQRINTIAAKGLALDDNPESAKLVIKNFGRFRGTDRPEIVAAMVSRKSFASELVNAIAKGTIAKSYLTAFDARQIRSFGDEDLNKRLADAWGETRESPQDRRIAMEKLHKVLAEQDLEAVNLSKGRVVFAELCGKCHRMYGEGQKIGPDLTGSNRSNLDYLVENVIDPSAVVQADYRVSILMMEDGRILNGVVVSKNDRTLSLQTQTELLVVNRDEIEEIKQTSQSPMPEGQLDLLSPAQIRDLFAYLRHPSQVSLP